MIKRTMRELQHVMWGWWFASLSMELLAIGLIILSADGKLKPFWSACAQQYPLTIAGFVLFAAIGWSVLMRLMAYVSIVLSWQKPTDAQQEVIRQARGLLERSGEIFGGARYFVHGGPAVSQPAMSYPRIRNGYVCLSVELLESPPPILAALIAHELGHLRQKAPHTRSASLLILACVVGFDTGFLALFIQVLAYAALYLIQRTQSHFVEYEADAFAVWSTQTHIPHALCDGFRFVDFLRHQTIRIVLTRIFLIAMPRRSRQIPFLPLCAALFSPPLGLELAYRMWLYSMDRHPPLNRRFLFVHRLARLG